MTACSKPRSVCRIDCKASHKLNITTEIEGLAYCSKNSHIAVCKTCPPHYQLVGDHNCIKLERCCKYRGSYKQVETSRLFIFVLLTFVEKRNKARGRKSELKMKGESGMDRLR